MNLRTMKIPREIVYVTHARSCKLYGLLLHIVRFVSSEMYATYYTQRAEMFIKPVMTIFSHILQTVSLTLPILT